jgi:hypothetical protein
MRRRMLLINLSFVLVATSLVANQSQAFADDGQAQKAIELLARSQTVDAKCKFLNVAEHDDLSSLVARAELALAQRTTVDITKQALARGRNAGQNSQCSETEKAELQLILSSAKQAAAMAPVAPVQEQVVSIKPALQLVKPPRIKTVSNTMPVLKQKTSPKKNAGLAQYASITEHYYLALRCGTLSSRKISGLYQTVVSTHEAVLTSFGRTAVATVMQQSEAKANAQNCG